MATACHFPVTAAQVGTYFVGQYYQVLQRQPDYVHQFYNDASTMLRIDGNTRETASAMLQIHTLILSLHYTGIEIKTAHSLESWNGGVLVIVSGSVLVKDFNGRRKFVQTFFFVPQEKGYFVLNDIFHFIDDEQPIHQHPVGYLAQSNLDSNLSAATTLQEQVPGYMLGDDIQMREFVVSANVDENGTVDNYNFSEEPLHQVTEDESILGDNYAVQSNGPVQNARNSVQDHLSGPVEEPVGEPQKHTYASIVAKGQTTPAVPPKVSSNKTTPPNTEWHHAPDPPTQQSVASSMTFESFGAEFREEVSAIEDDGNFAEVRSVYVRNVPPSVSASEIEEQFKKFGILKPDGVAIRTRKDIDFCYAFVEFEDVNAVQNAVKASTVQIAGHQVYIEGRRPNRSNSLRGRGRGGGRGGYQIDGARQRFGSRNLGRGGSQDGNDCEYNRPQGNGFHRQTFPQYRVYSGSQGLRNGRTPSE